MKYKQSMFNYINPTSDGHLLLYNSYVGFDSLASIAKEDFDLLISSLNNGKIDDNPQFVVLKTLGYFVDEDVNEKLLREQKYMDIVEEDILRLTILPTEKCNFKCKYCYETFEKGKMSLEMQKNLLDFVKKNIHRFSSMEVNWFGGEPLEALDVVENLSNGFMEICRAAKRSYSASMTTNAYNLTLDVFKKLYRLHVYNYQITIDGIQITHDSQRRLANGQGTFDKIVTNLLKIKSQIKSGVPRFTIRTNFTKESAQYLDEYLEFFSSRFSDDPRFTFSFQKAADWGGERVKEISNELLDNDFYKKLLSEISNKDIRLDISPHGALMNGSTCVCYANKRYSFVIGSDGAIYKCTGDFAFKGNQIGRLHEGNMLLDNYLHAQWICKCNRKYSECDNCYFSGACLSSSCPSSFVKGEKNNNDICLFEKNFIDYFLNIFNEKYFTKI